MNEETKRMVIQDLVSNAFHLHRTLNPDDPAFNDGLLRMILEHAAPPELSELDHYCIGQLVHFNTLDGEMSDAECATIAEEVMQKWNMFSWHSNIAEMIYSFSEVYNDGARTSTTGKLKYDLGEENANVLISLYGLDGGDPHTSADMAKKLGVSIADFEEHKKKVFETMGEHLTSFLLSHMPLPRLPFV